MLDLCIYSSDDSEAKSSTEANTSLIGGKGMWVRSIRLIANKRMIPPSVSIDVLANTADAIGHLLRVLPI